MGGEVARSYDAGPLNRIVNDPAVRRWVSGAIEGFIDTSALVADPANVLLSTEGGAFLFVAKGCGIYEVHTQFLPGYHASDAAKAARVWMFTHTDAKQIVTYVPRANRAARLLTLRTGFEFTHSDGEWPIDGEFSPIDWFKLEKESLCP